MQSMTFADWLMHGLRGAADEGFNRLDGVVDCKDNMRNVHYCRKWKQFAAVGFSPYTLRQQFRQELCPKQPLATGDLQFYRIDNVTSLSCDCPS
jgi:hypothetical protein